MKQSILLPLGLLMALVLVGCDGFTEVDTPASQLTGVEVFENRTTADAAVCDLYAKLRDIGLLCGLASSSSSNLGMYGDELDYYGLDIEPGLPFTNNLLASSAIVSQCWNESYHQIYCANAVIAGVQQSEHLNAGDRDQFTGEALLVRALVHFYLVNLYGDVPYIKTTDYEQNRLVARMPSHLVYENIIADLTQAESLLPEAYVSGERARANKAVASALLARVYLYNGQWAEASNAASAVLNNGEYALETDLERTFLKDASSTLWQFAPELPGDNANEAFLFNFIEGPPPYVALSDALLQAFESGDLRKEHWVSAQTDGSSIWYHPYKYKQSENTGESVEYSVVLRLSEQYLIRAEARARQGEIIGAKADLNAVRQVAGLPETTADTPEALIAAILQERRVELFSEYGHRFFDLKRLGLLDATLATKPGWETTDQLWPIPELELGANPNLGPQNPGY